MKCRSAIRLLMAAGTELRVRCTNDHDHAGVHVANLTIPRVSDHARTVRTADLFVTWKNEGRGK